MSNLIRRLPVFPTVLVLIAVGVMLRLGVWQLDRLHQKEALLARYAAAQKVSAEVEWSGNSAEADKLLYRHVRVSCSETVADHPVAGHNRLGELGWAQIQDCKTREGFGLRLVIGWSNAPYAAGLENAPTDARLLNRWHGGTVSGVLAPGPRLVADPPLAGLQANAKPDPSEIPNNHLSYAVQWFLFAATALVIYALALRKRWRSQAPD